MALMDNFCWCDSNNPIRLNELKKAVQACYDYSIVFGTPFISGKDSMSMEGIASSESTIHISSWEDEDYYYSSHPEKYRIFNFTAPDGISFPEYRFQLDYMEDYKFITEVYKRLLPIKEDFNLHDIIDLLKKNPELIFDVDEKTLCDYAAEDSDITFRLYKKLSAELKKENLEKVAYEIEFPLAPVLEDMERAGVKVDKKTLDKFSARLEKMIDEYKKKIWEIAGEEFNVQRV